MPIPEWERVAVIGRGANYGTAFEAALKISELTGAVAAPYSSADFLHGPIAIVEPGFPILAIAPSGPTLDGHARGARRRAARADVTVISDDPRDRGHVLELEAVPEWLSPLVAVIPAQQLAVGMAEQLGPRRRSTPRTPEGHAHGMNGIQITNVTKAYKNGPRAVDDVTLEVREGEFMVLVGPSGCGKSTLLKMIAGIEETTAGTIHIGGRDVTDLDPRKRDIAMVFQNYALYPHLSVRANLGFGLKLRKTSKDDIVDAGQRRRADPRARGDDGPQARRAVRRPAPAGRDGARDRPRAAGVPDGRAA